MARRMIVTCCLTALFLVSAASAEVLFEAVIDGAQAGTPSGATGTATLSLNDTEDQVTYTITFSGLEGVEGAAHFHNGAPGVPGPIMHGLPVGSPKTGVWNVTPFDVAELYAGRVYINIHTDLYGAGEIRGNVTFSAVPADEASWSSVKNDYR